MSKISPTTTHRGGNGMEFGFRIIVCADNTEIIDRKASTSFCNLSPEQMIDSMEVDSALFQIDREKRRTRKQILLRKKVMRNLFYKFAYMCGLI